MSDSPPRLLARATKLRLGGRVHFDRDCVGEVYFKPDDDYVVFRKVILDLTEDRPEKPGALFTVRFRFARFSDATNRRLSLIPAPFIVAQPGFRSKTWMFGRGTGMFQGVYEWDALEDAEAYWTSFPMKLMKRRAVTGSVTYEVEPL